MEILIPFLLLCMANLGSSRNANSAVFNVLNYGAVGDGKTDDSAAFLAAWTAACGTLLEVSTLIIPKGKTFLLNPVTFAGPCMSASITVVQVFGNIVAPDIKAWPGQKKNWIVFSHVIGLAVKGRGHIDGRGSGWWDQYNNLLDSSKSQFERPTALGFYNCNDLRLRGLRLINSPKIHVGIFGSTGITISNLHITAPKDSPNTDGIDIGQSSNIQIRNCIIGTGDDCVAIVGGTANINITGVACGPGHGISVGSLGRDGERDTVEGVHVRNCSFSGTKYGARIKSWQGGSGYARYISFEDITLVEASSPILIDQFYCVTSKFCANQTKAIQVSDVTFDGFYGTSITENAIQLSCSETVGCTDIVLRNINMTSAYRDHVLSSSCVNAHGKAFAVVNPTIKCLLP